MYQFLTISVPESIGTFVNLHFSIPMSSSIWSIKAVWSIKRVRLTRSLVISIPKYQETAPISLMQNLSSKLFLELTNLSKVRHKMKKIVYIDGNNDAILVGKDNVIVFKTFVTKTFEIDNKSQGLFPWRLFETVKRS